MIHSVFVLLWEWGISFANPSNFNLSAYSVKIFLATLNIVTMPLHCEKKKKEKSDQDVSHNPTISGNRVNFAMEVWSMENTLQNWGKTKDWERKGKERKWLKDLE